MQRLVHLADDESSTDALGAAVAQSLPARALICLRGTLGAGKTRLVQAIAAASGVDRRDVVSPTFVLIQPYQGRHTIYHMDAYRVRSDEEFLDLGPDEYFEEVAWTIIEWADRVEGCLPPERLDVEIDVVGPTSRRFTLLARGPTYEAVLRRLQAALASSRGEQS
ncbi:MAG TPA: tRNA (adenosine(37)-N6)-threonylcarbamoyltransferase complex ATPase subunit type 1 TsaE [Planctomycetaceae bacterium]|nr:tRNA (adenosine(37)-N6)-threonylcarbamoyltransferase complex ATPase subunit type 1 TsaE [Planctomycetaceae bacterium]